MARIWQSGFELNSLTAAVESTLISTGGGTLTIVSSPVNTGSYALSSVANGSNANTLGITIISPNGSADLYFRLYIRKTANPSTARRICNVNSGGTERCAIRMSTAGKLQLLNGVTQVGSDSPALNNDQWYRLEWRVDNVGGNMEGLIDGVSFASGSGLSISNYGIFTVGNILTSGNGNTVYYDDIAVNNTNGSFQTSWPGSGIINHLLPDSAGDSTQWTKAGSAPAAANFSGVNEVTPDDGTTFNSSTTLNQEDLFNLAATPSSIGTSDTINVVSVGVRFSSDNAASRPSFKLEIESTSGGTIEQSASITPAGTTWRTNTISGNPLTYPLTLYDLPGASTTPWTKADLDTTQIGYKLTTDATNLDQISTIWLSIDSTPSAGGGATFLYPTQRMRMGMGA